MTFSDEDHDKSTLTSLLKDLGLVRDNWTARADRSEPTSTSSSLHAQEDKVAMLARAISFSEVITFIFARMDENKSVTDILSETLAFVRPQPSSGGDTAYLRGVRESHSTVRHFIHRENWRSVSQETLQAA